MLLDVLVALLLAVALFKGWSKGLIVAVASFFAFLIGLAAALKLSAVVATAIGTTTATSTRWLPLLAFLLVFVGVLLLVRLVAKLVEGAAQLAMLGWANRLGGFLFYALSYLLCISIAVFYLNKLQLFNAAWQSSITYPYLQRLAPFFIEGLAQVLPFLKNVFAQLTQFFGQFARPGTAGIL